MPSRAQRVSAGLMQPPYLNQSAELTGSSDTMLSRLVPDGRSVIGPGWRTPRTPRPVVSGGKGAGKHGEGEQRCEGAPERCAATRVTK